MKTVAIIQARMGSTRLPGKVMLPLSRDYALTHVIRRVRLSKQVNKTIVATSEQTADDIIARYSSQTGASVFRGSESDVLERIYEAAVSADTDVIVRITGDCPLIDPEIIDTVVYPVKQGEADYASNTIERTFPRGLDVEAFRFDSFERVKKEATEPHHREHVTPYYREHPEKFDLLTVTSDTVFDDSQFQNRDDLRLTLDEANDYEVLREIYENVYFDDILPIRDAIRYVDEHDLMQLNANVSQKIH